MQARVEKSLQPEIRKIAEEYRRLYKRRKSEATIINELIVDGLVARGRGNVLMKELK